MVFLFFEVGGGEIMLIMFFVLVFFGSKKIPELARGLGKGMREFKDASAGIRREIQMEADKLKSDINVTDIQKEADKFRQGMSLDTERTVVPDPSRADTKSPDPGTASSEGDAPTPNPTPVPRTDA